MVDLNFMRKEVFTDWITRKIPNGQSIIGLKGNYGKGMNYITSLGFVMWSPSEDHSPPPKMQKNSSFLLLTNSPLKKFIFS